MRKPTALIIEDDLMSASIFSLALQEAQYDVTETHDGQEAEDYLSRNAPDVVILDLHLPKISGKDILAYIRTCDHLVDTQVVLISADALMTDYLSSQADLVLVKPIGFHQLRELTARLNPINRDQ